jgi:hypothetical protein
MVKVMILPTINPPYNDSEIKPTLIPKKTASAMAAVTASATAIHVKTFTNGEVVLDVAYA